MLAGSSFSTQQHTDPIERVVCSCPKLQLLEHTFIKPTPQAPPGVALLDLSSSAADIKAALASLTPRVQPLAARLLCAATNSSAAGLRTPMHTAVARLDLDLTQCLCAAGADPNRKDKRGYTPLMVLAAGQPGEEGEEQPTAMVRVLLQAGASTSVMNHKREPALWVAALRGHIPVVRELLLAGVHMESCVDPDGWGLLHAACIRGSSSVVGLLLEAGLDVHALNKHKQHPIHLASRSGCCVLVQLLLEANANPNAKDESGMTPLQYCAGQGSEQTKSLLSEFGAVPVANATGHQRRGNGRRRRNHK
eukprot:TRINITY_DN14578_c0_g1_i1.p1 TRINITY_DN14578_c0_g1~~TRINITY_DN14578_c0_g1_i1.p1  ORF type:complete len:307 (+),score=80.30 TRINITY_DN14578_c0_g1_i1:239-1159(+)